MQQLGLLAYTGGLTILIWAAADQLLTETEEIRVVLSVRTQRNSDMQVTAMEDTPAEFRVTVSGRASDVRQLRELGKLRIELTIEDEKLIGKGLGVLSLSLRDELRAHASEFVGCVVQSVEPDLIRVHVDRMIERSLPVVIRPGNLDYTVEPRADPNTVSVRLRQSVYDRIAADGPRVVLDAESYLANQRQDEPIKLSQIQLPRAVETDRETVSVASVDPETVTLRATLRSRLETGLLQAVPIKFQSSRSILNRFDIEFRDPNPVETLSIRVVGTPDRIERLVSGQQKTFAVILLGSSDSFKEGTFQFYKPQFNLPPGVELADDQSVPSFEIRLVARARPERDADIEH